MLNTANYSQFSKFDEGSNVLARYHRKFWLIADSSDLKKKDTIRKQKKGSHRLHIKEPFDGYKQSRRSSLLVY